MDEDRDLNTDDCVSPNNAPPILQTVNHSAEELLKCMATLELGDHVDKPSCGVKFSENTPLHRRRQRKQAVPHPYFSGRVERRMRAIRYPLKKAFVAKVHLKGCSLEVPLFKSEKRTGANILETIHEEPTRENENVISSSQRRHVWYSELYFRRYEKLKGVCLPLENVKNCLADSGLVTITQ